MIEVWNFHRPSYCIIYYNADADGGIITYPFFLPFNLLISVPEDPSIHVSHFQSLILYQRQFHNVLLPGQLTTA